MGKKGREQSRLREIYGWTRGKTCNGGRYNFVVVEAEGEKRKRRGEKGDTTSQEVENVKKWGKWRYKGAMRDEGRLERRRACR